MSRTAVRSRSFFITFIRHFLILVIAVSFGACAGGAEETGPGPDTQGTEVAEKDSVSDSGTATEQGKGPCDNPYYPVDTGTARKYKLSSNLPDGNSEYTLKQRMVDEDTFVEDRSYASGLVVSVNWNCTGEGLRTAEYVSQATMTAGSFQMETLESSGITIPANWEEGKEWATNYKVKAEVEAGPVRAEANGSVTLDHKLVSESESIRVPGGTFDAARVDTMISIDLKMRGTAIPTKEIKMSVWLSPKVGLVKQRVYGDFGEETVEFVGTE